MRVRAPVGASLAAGLVASLCCGGSLVFASLGLGAPDTRGPPDQTERCAHNFGIGSGRRDSSPRRTTASRA